LTRTLDLRLPEPERRAAASLVGQWRDVLYAPNPAFASPLDPGRYRSSFVVIPADGPAVRVSSLIVPAFGGEICRLRFEPLASIRLQHFGSFFEPSRRGTVYAMSADRERGAARAPDRPGWSYEGAPLAPVFANSAGIRLIRERIGGGIGDGAFAWVADRALMVSAVAGAEGLLLAEPDASESAVFVPAAGFYRALVDPCVEETPGATIKELLGYGGWEEPLRIELEIEQL
jgi:hypothetical protein